MKTQKLISRGSIIVAAAAAVILTVSTLWAADRSALEESSSWQHLAMDSGTSVKDAELARKINELGRAGWELVTVTPVIKEGSTDRLIYYFKKPLN